MGEGRLARTLAPPEWPHQNTVLPAGWQWFECKDALPVVLHADHCPALLFRFVVESLCEGADFGVRQTVGRAISIFTIRIVVQKDHRQASAVAGFGVFEHLAVTS